MIKEALRIPGGIEIFTDHIWVGKSDRKGERFGKSTILHIDRMRRGHKVDIVRGREEIDASIIKSREYE
jgi:hypothetical protein